jgi:hypothetical protein
MSIFIVTANITFRALYIQIFCFWPKHVVDDNLMCVLKVMLALKINTDTESAKGNYCPLKISMRSVYSNPYHYLHCTNRSR